MKTILQHIRLLNFLLFLFITFNAFSATPIDEQCYTTNICRQADSLTLITLYDATDGPNWYSSWDFDQPMDTWHGITLDTNGCVAEIFLGNEVVGYIPASFGDLSELKVLECYGADFSNGPIPAEIGNLSKLERITMIDCQLSGAIPAEIGNLNNLTSLYLPHNHGLTGGIPPELGNLNNLDILYLGEHNLSGTIPAELGNLTNLTRLTISNNNGLGGSIPPELGNLTNLTWLDIFNNNNLGGSIPPELGNLTNLMQLRLTNNNLSGTIPAELGNIINLMWLRLSINNLSGSIPSELGNLSNLKSLTLDSNALTGEIPTSLSNIPSDAYFSIAHNQLTGCYVGLETFCTPSSSFWRNNTISNGNYFDVPWESFCATGSCIPNPCVATDREALIDVYIAAGGSNSSLPWDTTRPVNTWQGITLDINGCVWKVDFLQENLVGTIAPEISNLSELSILFMGGSQLGGTIPPGIGNLTGLTQLIITGTQISGNIPPELGNLSDLHSFSLSDNQLSGNIPIELGNLSNLNSMLLNDNQLTGNIPLELAQLSNLGDLNLQNNQLTGNIPAALGNLSNLQLLYLNNNQLSGCYDANLVGLCGQLINNSNSRISDGNNFDVPWEDFCSIGVNACLSCSVDYYPMAAFANAITNWGSTNPWDLTQAMSTWDGVTLNADGCVDAIDLDENNMSGIIPPELGNLTSIRTLHLGDNNFSGMIPPELGNLNTLNYLNLDGNALMGNIPPELGNISALTRLYLSYNQLSGSIPPELANLTNMWDLGVHNNQLSGCYDSELLSLCGQLAYSSNGRISNGNNFDAPWEDFCATTTGSCTTVVCPTQQEQYDALKAFYLSTDGDNWNDNDNWPTAAFFNANPTVPPGITFANWDALVVNGDGCVISMNFDDEHIHGTIPPEFGNLTTLEYLDLGSNNLSGSLPAEMGNLSNLTFMNLSNNNFTGSVPPELGNLSSLEAMYLNYNNLSGSIPPELGNLPNVMTLAIRSNQLSGNIPTELGNLPNLVYLGLDGNQLTGTIPASLGNITSLTSLGLKNNQLSGCYDMSLQNLCSQLTNYSNTNAQISDGNNFDATWEDFCATEAGACDLCPTDLNLSNPLSTGTYQAGETLSSESTVPTGMDVQFKAGDVILLDSGFIVESGSDFSGEIEDCDGN